MRYRYDQILGRIREKVEEEYGPRKERGHKALYVELDIEKSQWQRKWDGDVGFSWEEFTALSEHFKAPPGWPFISWDAADANERAMKLLERLAPSGSPPQGEHTPEPAAPSTQPERRTRKGRK